MKGDEPAATPELSPNPAPLTVRKSRKGLAIAIVLQVVVLGFLIFTYVVAETSVASAADNCTSAVGDFEVTGVTTVLANLTIENPSDIDLHLNRLQAEISFGYGEYGGESFDLGSVDVSDIFLPSNGLVSVPVSIQTSIYVANLLTGLSYGGYTVTMTNTYSVTGTWLFMTITKEATETVKYELTKS